MPAFREGAATRHAGALRACGMVPGVVYLAATSPSDSIAPADGQPWPRPRPNLLRSHGPELYRAGWDALDLFGLHRHAPVTSPAGWGLAWLRGSAGEMRDVAPGVVQMRRGSDGARLIFWRGCAVARAGVVPAWDVAAHASLRLHAWIAADPDGSSCA